MSTAPASPAASGGTRKKIDKYLVFRLADETYGFPALRVKEIIRYQEITPVPQMPVYIKGIINLRGRIIPVIDMRVKFQLGRAELDKRTCIVITLIENNEDRVVPIGLIVDAVNEVVPLPPQNIEATPDFGHKVHVDYIKGLARVNEQVVTLLDIDRMVTDETVKLLEKARQESA